MGSQTSARAKKPAAKAAKPKASKKAPPPPLPPKRNRNHIKSGGAAGRTGASLVAPEMWDQLLEAMSRTNNATYACNVSGIHRNLLWTRLKEDSLFKQRFLEASEKGIEACEDEVRRRAFHGVSKPVFYQGVPCGTVQEYSDQLAMFMLKAEKPDRYRDKLMGSGLQPHEHAAILRQALKEMDEQTAGADE